MTKRLTALGFAAVAVVWGPYVYAELARKPLPPATVEPPSPIVDATPVAYVSPATERAQLLAALAAAREKAAAEHEEPVAHPEAPESPESPSTTVSAATEPPPPAAEIPLVQPPQPAAADPAAHAAQPVAAPAVQEAAPAKDEPAEAQHAPAAKEEPSDDRHEETKEAEEDTKRAPADEAPTPESLAPAFRSAFDRESRDVAWATGEEPRLAKLLTGAGVPESAISEVRCQSTVCRIALNSVDLKAIQQSPLYQLISARVKDEFGTLGLDAMGDGEQHAAVYVLRKGYELEHGQGTN